MLINNAGYEKSGKFVDMGQEDILNMISVNIKGMTMIQKIILPYMQKGRKGKRRLYTGDVL